MVSLPLLVLSMLAVLYGRLFYPPALFFLVGFLPTGLSLLRANLGAPIYAYDFALVAVWWYILSRKQPLAGIKSVAGWMIAFLVVIGLMGTLIPMFSYGVHLEMIWNMGHTGLALAAVGVGAFLYADATPGERRAYACGLATALVLLAVVGGLQRASSVWNSYFINLFYDGGLQSDDASGVGVAEALGTGGRVAGPFGSPNTFGVVVLIAAVNFWLFSAFDEKLQRYWLIVASSMLIVLLASASRQAMIASTIIVIGYIFNSPVSRSAKRGVILFILVATVSLFVDFGVLLDRLKLLSDLGISEGNVAARLSTGPERFFAMLDWNPFLFITGAGLEVQKLVRYGIPIDAAIVNGFVSNGYLLYIYYFGVFGCFVFVLFWLAVANRANRLPTIIRRVAGGSSIAILFLVFSDNHALLAEELIVQLMVFSGAVLSKGHQHALSAHVIADPSRAGRFEGKPLGDAAGKHNIRK